MSDDPSKRPIEMRPIGIVHSPHTDSNKTPIQYAYAEGYQGTVEVFEEYAAGLKDVEGFSHIYLIFYFDRARSSKLIVKPFLDDVERGVFATRSPSRPNPIGLSILEVLKREGNILYVEGLDILDGTPVLDIKPYTTGLDGVVVSREGWHKNVDPETARIKGRREG